MNARFDICQAAHDAKLPPPVSETPEELARAEWLYDSAERMIRYGWAPQGVTMQQFALAVDEHVNARLGNCEIDSPALGNLLISIGWASPDKNAIAELLGHSEHPLGMLGEIAEKLLQPLADDARIAQAEDAEL